MSSLPLDRRRVIQPTRIRPTPSEPISPQFALACHVSHPTSLEHLLVKPSYQSEENNPPDTAGQDR